MKTPHRVLVPVGLAMRDLRERKHMTQGDIVRATGLERSYVSRLESNQVAYPRFNTVKKIANSFGMTVDEFLSFAIRCRRRAKKNHK